MNPDALVSAVADRVRASLPPGLGTRDLDGFLARNRGRLVVQLRAALKVEAEPVEIPWRAGDLSGPAGGRIERFDAEKARASGVRWSREADDLEPGFDPPEHFDAYDLLAIQVSGGKDSVACITALHRLIGHRPDLWSRVELWHQDVDGAAEPFMDWPVTRAYVLGLGALYGVPVRFAWREGGFHRELMRKPWGKRAGKVLETPEGPVMIGEPPPPNNLGRRRFPALTADLRIRWCSGFLKIDVARTLLVRSVAEGSKKILVISGERAAESAPRSRYHRGQDTEGSSGRRQVHQLRLVYDHSDAEVWDELRLAFPGKGYGIQPHAAYELGWSRCSCAGCIFSSGEDLARLREALPDQFTRLAQSERDLAANLEAAFSFLVEERARLKAELPTADRDRARMIRGRLREISGVIGRTVVEGKTVPERADAALLTLPADFDHWRAYADGTEPWTLDHMLRGPDAPVFNSEWTLPSGAINPDSSGPPT